MTYTPAWTALLMAIGLSTVGLNSVEGSPQGSLSASKSTLAAPVDADSAAPTAAQLSPESHPLLSPPTVPMRAYRLFDPPPKPWLAGHRGIDLLTAPASEVHSPGPGVVAFAGYVVNRPVLSIELDVGLRASMEPVATLVEVGQRVQQGEVVGTVDDAPGAGHCEPQWCVHWGLRQGDEYVNPLDWLAGYGPIKLLPLEQSDWDG